jgi:DNA-binding transcriptional ArsR family regulator
VVSFRVKVLEQAGLISRSRDGQRRPCRLRLDPLVEIAEWAEHTRAAWEQRLDRLDAHLRHTRGRTASQPDRSSHEPHPDHDGSHHVGPRP